ncbi:hypothetical protein H112_08504 [Trichophyton rubrum D6]|uniref:Mtf2-like C-terminal domain-containing protein n=3 Tax=Trichophyton rubrum TaxID=5551 RepID=A0A178EUC3_TRIRU|nr:uncharacterized protein TERG_01064 [Trichophyton rubrum CBS 118892]EZF10317.1 hypothetical protein H100_08526 [Trichophyton rubrum MR850]EZF37209.1 hypothetical protein H102_08486 [Trichophyton rubrum CBS 100081]EZF47770.1 hypothetical protein H103_08507 [Trichophyton rubrum CBS 288.86]EZF58358.1 hypothetical protein H104_08460 [Trichophyton rubrum CBS 289.86]EZF79574.1 hypothetical protein H110_08510 [Trichophyton rubrum MR1448]EZF89913.1 hypothetical protein H113_08578 [Trichophyton rubr
MPKPHGLVSLCREPTHLPFLYLTATLTAPVHRAQPNQPRLPAGNQQRCPFSNSSRHELRSYPGRRHAKSQAPISTPAPRNSRVTGRFSVPQNGNTSANDSSSAQDNREIKNIFSSVLKTMSELNSRSSRKKLQQPLNTLSNSGLEKANVNDKLHNFQLTKVDPSSPDEAKFAGIDLSVAAFAVAQTETKRICKEIDDAVMDGKGDLGIWKVCENMIFPMLKQAGLDEILSSGSTASVSESGDNASGNLCNLPNKYNNTPCQPICVHPDIPIVTVVRHVYPATLLHALRILQNKFPMSPLTIRLFESIRSHGRASFVIGSSKELFHELIDFRWRVHNDLPSIVSLLKEMEENGIDFDKRTLELVERIRQRGARAILKARQSDGRNKNSSIKSRNRRTGSNAGVSWWDSPAIRKAYRELTSWAKGMDAQIREFKELEEKAQELWSIKRP